MGSRTIPAKRPPTYPAWSDISLDATILKAERLCERHRAEAADPGPVHASAQWRRWARLRVMEVHLERLRALQASRAASEPRQAGRRGAS